MPDGEQFTQLELPNVVELPNKRFAWIFSTTNRTSEKQSIRDIDAQVRLYFSDTIDGALSSFRPEGSTLFKSNESELYGANLVRGSEELLLRLFHFDDAKRSDPLSLPKAISLRDFLLPWE